MLPIQVSEGFLKELMNHIQSNPDAEVTVDLENQLLSTPVGDITFDINPCNHVCNYACFWNNEIKKGIKKAYKADKVHAKRFR